MALEVGVGQEEEAFQEEVVEEDILKWVKVMKVQRLMILEDVEAEVGQEAEGFQVDLAVVGIWIWVKGLTLKVSSQNLMSGRENVMIQ